MTKFREHHGSLSESMETVVEVQSKEDLVALLQTRLDPFGFRFEGNALSVEPYSFDDRIGWNAHIVRIGGYGVAGFTDGPLQ